MTPWASKQNDAGVSIQVVIAFVFLIGLGTFPIVAMDDSFDKSQYRLTFDNKLRIEIGAPIIVQGRVLEVREIGKPKISPGDSRVKTQQTQIKIEVEQVLKGAVRQNQLEFVYFTYSATTSTDLGVRRYIPEVRQRRIYFLKDVDNSYRSVGDVIDYTLQVSAGLHVRGYCRGKQPGCCLAELLLTPGASGFDPTRFLADLRRAAYIARVLCPQEERSLLDKLTKNSNRQVASGAREIIADEEESLRRGGR